ncbi:ABC transporter substrate-binding protein [Caldalkalibacillus mannanilyticus]|uniref:ABC transporter substrate-binding protein n=1 Tax=Caldalkalibacillus mannanilyticus TaxID=1418 RepID=UPI000469C876|nr:ABC transporter substrate-binding protein [Caldalkalibacillus mannanilyticus]
MKKLRLGLFLLVFSLFFTLPACSGSTDNPTVRIAEVTRSIFYAPQYIALSQGFFEEEGLEVQITTTWGGDKTMTTLLSDGADIALVGSETSIYVHQQGSDDPVINFAQLTQTDGTFLVSRTEMDSFSWDDLRGSVFLGQRKGGMPQMVGEYVLKKNGIHPDHDLELIQNIDFGNIASAFASGTGQFVQLFEPQATLFEMEGIGHVVASFGEESGHVPYTVFMAKQSYLEKNPETMQKFTNAIYKAQKWVYEQPSERIAEALLPFFEETDVHLITAVVERYKKQQSYDPTPLLDEEEWDRLQDIIEEAGELHKRVDYKTLVNTDFAKKAMQK